MGKGKKKGGKAGGGAGAGGGGGGDQPGDKSKPETQPSASQERGGGDAPQQKKVDQRGGKGGSSAGAEGGGGQPGDKSKPEKQPSASQERGGGDAPQQKKVGQRDQRQDRPQQQQQGHPGGSAPTQQKYETVQSQQHQSAPQGPWGQPKKSEVQKQDYPQQQQASPPKTQVPPQQRQQKGRAEQTGQSLKPQTQDAGQSSQGQGPRGFQHQPRHDTQQVPQGVPGQQQPRGPPQQSQQGQRQQYKGPPQHQLQQRGEQQGQKYREQPGDSSQQYAQGQQQRRPPHLQAQQPERPTQKQEAPKPQPEKHVQSGGIQPSSSFKKETGDQVMEKYTPRSILSLQDQLKEMSIMQEKNIATGTRGRKIQIETNHLELKLGKLEVAYHYDVQIDPDIPKKFLRTVMEKFRQIHYPTYYPAFDGRKNLYSPRILVPEGKELQDQISINDGMSGREKIFKVAVKFANTVDLTPLRNVRMTQLSPQEAIQCVEIVLRSAPSMRCIQAGRSFFTRPTSIIDLGEGMEMYQGFYQSVVRGWKPLLNVDVAHKAFPKETDLIRLTMELCSSYRQQLKEEDLRGRQLTQQQITILTKFLRTLRIVYEIRGQPGSKKEYRVNGLKGCPRNVKFRPDNGPEITIEEYFARKKNFRLQFPLMPTIWVGNQQRKDPILLPAELCTVVPGQPVNRKMTEGQTSAMIRHAATSTSVRKDKIMRSLNDTRHNEDHCIRQFGFSIGNGFEQIQARILTPPVLEYDKRTVTPSRGVWRQENIKFLKGAQINQWTIISACGQLNEIGNLADMIYNFAPKCGMHMGSKAFEPFDILRGRQASSGDIVECFRRCLQKGYDLVFVVIPDSGPTYSDVKKAAELNVGCLTQCIKRKTVLRLNPSTVNNILLKVNSKLNGTNHCLNRRPQILSEPCMIMGADVTHPSPDSQNIPSVAAVTASHDPRAFCYNISCRLQSPKAEIITDLQAITREHLLYFYYKNNKQKPRRIVFFRDGVSEGQFLEVLRQEVRAIRSACTSLEADYQPKITFLVVQKRHHTRFFPKDPRDSEDRNGNVPAGTCVDTHITNPNMQDFYLVSHASIQGVAKPTKYCTLWDDNDMTNDDIEELTYHLCHLFTRCNRSVSYPAPTYYAHLAAARAKVYIENDTLDLGNLENELWRINILDSIRKQQPMFFV